MTYLTKSEQADIVINDMTQNWGEWLNESIKETPQLRGVIEDIIETNVDETLKKCIRECDEIIHFYNDKFPYDNRVTVALNYIKKAEYKVFNTDIIENAIECDQKDSALTADIIRETTELFKASRGVSANSRDMRIICAVCIYKLLLKLEKVTDYTLSW